MTNTWMLRSLARETWNLVRGVRASAHPGIHPAQPIVELIFQLAHGQIGHVHLAHLGNHDEPLAGHVQGVRLLHVAGEDQYQHVARAQPIILVHRARLHRLEPGRGSPKRLQSEQLEAATLQHAERIGQRVGPGGIGSDET